MSQTYKLVEKSYFHPIPEGYHPKNILIIRFHSIGDVAITLPYVTSLKKLYPSANIDYLTEINCLELPESCDIFRRVYSIDLSLRKNKLYGINRYITAINKVRFLKKNKYDAVLDLQRNRLSKIIRIVIKPEYFGEFDRFSPYPAGIRVQNTFIKTGLKIEPEYNLNIKPDLIAKANDILLQNGWDGKKKIFVLNPAGLWITRNWQVENYIRLAEIISKNFDACFLLLGDERIKKKAEQISLYRKNIINLVNKTSLSEAFAILQFASAIISEDSGLMHMAWVLGIPTIVLLGSSRSDWTSPVGKHTITLNSSDLECGDCMSPICKYNDVHCLSRYTPEFVYEKLVNLVKN